jgi:GNAT superfamily N-acetyltransferase
MRPNWTPTTDIRRVVTEADRQAVYAFRYAVIVDELRLSIAAADHERRMVIDAEDDHGHSLAAFRDGVIVGALRVNFLRDGDVEPHRTIFGLDRLPPAQRAVTSASSRFLVTAALRGTSLAVRITQAWYRFCRTTGIEWDYILVKGHLAGLYLRLGWVPVSESVHHPEVGVVVPLRLHLTDEPHLRAIRSPFVACLETTAHM